MAYSVSAYFVASFFTTVMRYFCLLQDAFVFLSNTVKQNLCFFKNACNMTLYVFLENTMSPLSNRKVINEVINESNQKLYF